MLKNNNFTEKLKPNVSTKPQLINQINEFCNLAKLSENINLLNSAYDSFMKISIKNNKIIQSIDCIKTDMEFISNYITTVKTTLDESIH